MWAEPRAPGPDPGRARSATEPAYRLTYTFKSPDEVSIGFQIAPPGKDFGNYITASARRKK